MKSRLTGYRKTIYFAIIILAFGITFSTALSQHSGSLGTVFIAVGGLFFIIGMRQKMEEKGPQKPL